MRNVACAWVCIGSSPHARETRRRGARTRLGRRLIPACAGNTAAVAALPLVVPGSSPHARETLRHPADAPGVNRLIPACAGNTSRPPTACSLRSAHPRMRGKHQERECEASATAGSSPHARETRQLRSRRSDGLRLIPACAGNTQSPPQARRTPSAHPRMRGKHLVIVVADHVEPGSSPHARETLDNLKDNLWPERLIPACAGNTGSRARCDRGQSAHPRMRGKHARLIPRMNCPCGSSPHARETPQTSVREQRVGRLIPACAGNTAR